MPQPESCVVSLQRKQKPAGGKRSIEERLEILLSKLEAECAERAPAMVIPFKRSETLEDFPEDRESRG